MLVVTGATGFLGHLVIDELLKEISPEEVVAVGRDPAKAADLVERGVDFRHADYDAPETLGPAFEGAGKLMFISSNEVGRRTEQHRAVVNAAKAANVGLIGYTSILRADSSPIGLAKGHRATEEELSRSGIPFVILRNCWYNENYTASLPVALDHGLIGCAGDGRISAAARADYAAAAARVMLDDGHAGKVYELAGDRAFTMTELAGEISKQAGRTVTYSNLPQADYEAALIEAGLPKTIAAMLADADAGAVQGALFDDGRELSRLIGRPTTSIADSIRKVLAETG